MSLQRLDATGRAESKFVIYPLRIAILAVLAAAFSTALAGPASALPLAQIEISGAGSGEVVGVPGPTGGSPESIDCSYDGETEEQTGVCQAEAGEVLGFVGIEVEYREVSESAFGGWSIVEGTEFGGSCSAFSSACGLFSLGTPIRLKARFDRERVTKYHLLARKVGTGDGTVASMLAGIDCAGGCAQEGADFPENAVVRLHASPDAGSSFDGWSGCDAEPDGECEVTMGEVREVTSEFNTIPRVTLTVIKRGQFWGGTVTTSPIGIECGPACAVEAAEFHKGETVTLTAISERGYAFTKWFGCRRTASSACEVTLNEPLTRVVAVLGRTAPRVHRNRGRSKSSRGRMRRRAPMKWEGRGT